MNLQQWRDTLAELPENAIIRYGEHGLPLGEMISWRGDYSQPTIPPFDGPDRRVRDVLAEAEGALAGELFQGYKGGYYVMDPHGTVWADNHDECYYRRIVGVRLSRLNNSGSLLVAVVSSVHDC